MVTRSSPWLPILLGLVAAGACGGGGTAIKPADPDRGLAFKIHGMTFNSSGGYAFAVLPEDQAGIVRVDVRYPVGAGDDPVGKEGLAHLVEHLLFEVEVPLAGRTTSLSGELGTHALYWNATTTQDYTHYESQGLPNQLDRLIWIEAERARTTCDRITEAAFEREKQVVLNELRQRRGADGGDLLRSLNEALYPGGHRYGRSDSLESVNAITRKDVCDFITDAFQRGVATVVVTGRVSEEAMQASITRHFAQVPQRRVTETASVSAPKVSKRRVRIEADVVEPHVLIAWPMPAENSRERRFFDLGRDMLERRFSAFADTYGWGHDVYLDERGGGKAPYLVLAATLNQIGDAQEAVEAAGKAAEWTTRREVWGEERDDPRWNRQHMAHSRDLIGAYESLSARARMFTEVLAAGDEGLNIVKRLDEVRAAHPDDIRKVLDQWLDLDRAVVVEIVPAATGKKRMALATALGGSHDVGHGAEVDESEADRSIEVPSSVNLTLATERFTTENGLEVIMWPYGSLPIVRGRLLVHAGSAHEPEGLEGLANFSDAYVVNEEDLIFGSMSLSGYVDSLVESLGLVLRDPGGDVSEETRSVWKKQLSLGKAEDLRAFYQAWGVAVSGAGHPYARPGMSPESLSRMDRDARTSWERKHMVPANSTLILAGKFDSDLIRKHIEYQVGHVASGERTPEVAGETDSGPSWIVGQGRDDAASLEIVIGFAGAPGIGTDWAERQVLEGILESKLASLRGDLAITYGFSVDYEPRQSGGLWRLRGHCDPARAAEAGAAIVQALNEVRAGDFRAEFVLARRKVLESLLASASSAESVTERLTLMARFGLRDHFFELLASLVAELKPAAIQKLIDAELGTDRQVWGTWGSPKAGHASVAAAKQAQKKPAAAPEAAPAPAESSTLEEGGDAPAGQPE